MQRLILHLALLLLTSSSEAATITALRAHSNEPGEIEGVVILELGPGEDASIFEGFQLRGSSASVAAIGDTWPGRELV